jgi:hypothetical protein
MERFFCEVDPYGISKGRISIKIFLLNYIALFNPNSGLIISFLTSVFLLNNMTVQAAKDIILMTVENLIRINQDFLSEIHVARVSSQQKEMETRDTEETLQYLKQIKKTISAE